MKHSTERSLEVPSYPPSTNTLSSYTMDLHHATCDGNNDMGYDAPGARAWGDERGVARPDLLLKVELLYPTQHVRPVEASDGEDMAAIGDCREVGPYLVHVREGVPLVCPCQEEVQVEPFNRGSNSQSHIKYHKVKSPMSCLNRGYIFGFKPGS